MPETLYIIKWKSTHTGATGQGTKGFLMTEAQKCADVMNNRDDEAFGLTHWIEAQTQAERRGI
jgi:hypothetical protein